MSTAVIYSKTTCPWCVKAKELLAEKGVTVTEYVIGVSPEAATKELVESAVGREVTTVPQILLDEGSGLKYIGGCTELYKHYRESL